MEGKNKHSPDDEMGDITLISIRDKIKSMRLEIGRGSSFIRQQKNRPSYNTERGLCNTEEGLCNTWGKSSDD